MDRIVYCTDEFLEDFKTNFPSYIDMYKNKDIEKIKEIFSDENNVRRGKIEFEYSPLKLKNEVDNPEKENIKIIYNTFKDLKPSVAIQEKLWVAMYNTYYLDHLLDYVDEIKDSKNFTNRLESSVVFTWGKKRSQIVHNLSRLWWLGNYLYDDESENPYEILDFYTDTKDIIGKSTAFFSSNLTNNKNLTFGILEAIKELTEAKKIENKREYYVEVNKYFNLVGGVRLLDFMTREEIKDEAINYLLEII